jgi:hypothetical protein
VDLECGVFGVYLRRIVLQREEIGPLEFQPFAPVRLISSGFSTFENIFCTPISGLFHM